METRANFILIGAFTLLAILGTLGFFLWLASVQIDRNYASYGILFEDVSGLDASGDVRFNGISVGKVIGLQIYGKDPSKVFATVQVDAAVPVRTDTVAQLLSQGVTGVAYVSLSGGTPGAASLTALDGALPIIPSRRSTLQALVEDAPNLVIEATRLLKQVEALTGPENQAFVTGILRNVDASSRRLDQALTDFSAITGTVSAATAKITLFTDRLDSIGATAQTTLERADTALASAQRAFDSAQTALAASGTVIRKVEGTFTQAETLMRDTVPGILGQVSGVLTRADGALSDIQRKAGDTLDGFGQTASLLNARMAELETSLRGADTAFGAVTKASDDFDTLIAGDGTLLVGEARAVLADAKAAIGVIDTVVRDDVPAVMADIRKTVTAASVAVDRVAGDVTGLTSRIGPLADGAERALESANALFARARVSLGALDTALGRTEGVLSSARTAFDAATGLMQTDLSPVLEDIRSASSRISSTVEDVGREIPAILTELRALIGRADAVVAQVQGAVSDSAPGIGAFARTGLPELTQLSAAARGLVTTLDSLAKRIGNDPARFLLDNRVPDYRR